MTEEDLHLQMAALQELLDKYHATEDATPPPPPPPPAAQSPAAAAAGPPREMAALPHSLMKNLLGQMGKRRSICQQEDGGGKEQVVTRR